MNNEDDYKPIKGINRMRDYVVDKVIKENQCLIMGPRDLIDRFSEDCGVSVDFLMVDMLTFDNQTESVPMKVYNRRSKEILLCCLANKEPLVNVVTRGMTENVEESKDLVALFLEKKKYKDGYIFNADSRCAKTEDEKIKLVSSLFRVPDNKTKNEMIKLSKDKSVVELDKFFDRIAKNIPHGDQKESFLKSLGINDSRYDYLQEILIRLSGRSTSAGKLAEAKEIDDMNHEVFLDLLEKEEGMDDTEMLYLAFSQGVLMQKFSSQLNEKFFHLEEDNDERLKSIGKRHSCEVRKSSTIFKIENLSGLNLREKLKATFWAGNYNEKFYGEENDI
jgi:hypothetical protein